jgi:hypothetical protein
MEISKSDEGSGMNLNELKIPSEGFDEPQEHYDGYANDSSVTVLFKHLESSLIHCIDGADIVVGCIAWLTNKSILEALSKKAGVALVVQKEDFLRPDIDAPSRFASSLRRLYRSLPGTLTRYDDSLSKTRLHMMSCCSDPTIEAVRCVGNHNSDKCPAFPRMHHKFVVFCRLTGVRDQFQPYAVWTGSFNFTENATRSFENALILRDPDIVEAYFQEFGQVAALSEPLDWRCEWAAPEWRIGT